jgi:hypothetical protein
MIGESLGVDPVGESSGVGLKRPQECPSSTASSNDDHILYDPSSSNRDRGYYHHRHRDASRFTTARRLHGMDVRSNDVDNNKSINGSRRQRRTNKDELQYAAFTAHDELALRRQLSRSSLVDDENIMDDGCRVVTSREYYGEEERDGFVQHPNKKRTRDDDEYNLASMYMIAGLLQSSRHHYDFATATASNDDDEAPDTSESSRTTIDNVESPPPPIKKHGGTIIAATKGDDVRGGIDNDAREEDGRSTTYSCEDNSEGLSTWTPSSSSSSSFRRTNYCASNNNNIDNDNRSDGQSSDMAFGAGGGGGSSTSSYSDSSDGCGDGYGIIDDARAAMTMTTNDNATDKYNHDYDGPYAVIG